MDDYASARVCKWFQCSLRFESLDDLRDHVVQAHVRTAQPLPRRDVALYRRIEEGMARSLSLNDSETYESHPHALKRRRVEKEGEWWNASHTRASPTSRLRAVAVCQSGRYPPFPDFRAAGVPG